MPKPSNARDLTVLLTSSATETTRVGTLVERGRRLFFEYDPEWIESGLDLSPFNLQTRPGLIEHTARSFGQLPGLFDDSLPDGWGLLLMDRHFRKIGLEPAAVSPLHRLAWLGTRTMGALTYNPPTAREDDADLLDSSLFELHELAEAARAVYAGDAAEVLPQLLRSGGSPGGARPKVLVGYNEDNESLLPGESDLPDGFAHWLVKFSTRKDHLSAGAVEYAYSLMARESGLIMPRTRLFETVAGDRFFGVLRFDRTAGNRRHHIHTFGNLIESNFRIPSCDYRDLLKATTILTRDRRDSLQAFSRLVFNVLAHNRDDHVKNFAFVLAAETNSWSLSPAYDLTFSHGPGGEHTMTIGGEGKAPGVDGMLAIASEFDIRPTEADAIVERVQSAIARWPELADEAGVAKAAKKEIGSQIGI